PLSCSAARAGQAGRGACHDGGRGCCRTAPRSRLPRPLPRRICRCAACCCTASRPRRSHHRCAQTAKHRSSHHCWLRARSWFDAWRCRRDLRIMAGIHPPGGTGSPSTAIPRFQLQNNGAARAVADAMLALWEREFPATVRVLAAVKDEKRDYRPDARSRSAWELATHIATSDLFFLESIRNGVFQFDPEKAKQAEAAFSTVADIAAFYEEKVPKALAAVRAIPDDQLNEPLDFFGMMTMPRAQWIGIANKHSVHHRGKLSTHMEALGSKVPESYGPSADAEPAPAGD